MAFLIRSHQQPEWEKTQIKSLGEDSSWKRKQKIQNGTKELLQHVQEEARAESSLATAQRVRGAIRGMAVPSNLFQVCEAIWEGLE